MRTSDRSRSARMLRGGIVATTATGVALASHVAGGGAVPGLLGVLVPWAMSLWVCTLLAGRRPGRWRTMISVAASQAFFHVLFVLGTPTGATSAGHGHHHGGPSAPFTPSATTVDLVQADATMWIWHAAAAAATIALLYRGEVALHHLRDLAGRASARLLPRLPADRTAVLVEPRPRGLSVVGHLRPAAPGPELAPLRRRGPPLLHAL